MSQQPPPEWRPASQPTRSPSIDDYAPPKISLPWIVTGVCVVVILGLLLVMLTRPPTPPSSQPNPSPVPTPSATWGHPFITDDESVSGTWDVLEHQWTSNGLEVQVRIALEKGLDYFYIQGWENDTINLINSLPNEIDGVQFLAGDDRTAWLVFNVGRKDITLMLTDEYGTQLSAVEIPA